MTYHKLNCLNNTNVSSYSSGDHMSEINFIGLNQGVDKFAFLLETLGDNPFLHLFQVLEAACIPWFMAPSSIIKPAA